MATEAWHATQTWREKREESKRGPESPPSVYSQQPESEARSDNPYATKTSRFDPGRVTHIDVAAPQNVLHCT